SHQVVSGRTIHGEHNVIGRNLLPRGGLYRNRVTCQAGDLGGELQVCMLVEVVHECLDEPVHATAKCFDCRTGWCRCAPDCYSSGHGIVFDCGINQPGGDGFDIDIKGVGRMDPTDHRCDQTLQDGRAEPVDDQFSHGDGL